MDKISILTQPLTADEIEWKIIAAKEQHHPGPLH